MDEYLGPTESWELVNAKRQKKYNLILAFGLTFFSATMVYCLNSSKTQIFWTPYHLDIMKLPKDKKEKETYNPDAHVQHKYT
jgi:hypothetical protein